MPKTSKTPMTDAEIIKTLGMSVQHALKNMRDFAKNLELQIESLKCCENCKYAGNTLWDDYSEPCNDCSKDASKWEARK